MTLNQLEQYRDLSKEVKMLERRIADLESRPEAFVSDSVVGSSPSIPYQPHTITIKGYGNQYQDKINVLQVKYIARKQQLCKELEEICPQFKTEEALEFAKDSGTLYKAHVMRVLWQYGLSDGMYNTVYRSLFGLRPVRGKILHTPVYETVDTILNLIQECRGVAVLAHPSVYHSMPLARELIAAGRLDGVEIDHPRNTEEDKAELEQLAAEYGLIVTGGTDYHGMNTNTPHPVGTCTTADEQIARIRALAEARKK